MDKSSSWTKKEVGVCVEWGVVTVGVARWCCWPGVLLYARGLLEGEASCQTGQKNHQQQREGGAQER